MFKMFKGKSERAIKPVKAKYTTTFDGSQWSVAMYGMVEFLRGKWYLRGLFALTGVAIGVAAVAQFAGFHPWGTQISLTTLCMFCTPWLLWIATISGDDFEVVFASKKARQEREEAERTFVQSSTPEDAIALDMKRLNEYYIINQEQAKSSFRWAIIAMVVGFTTIIAGVWMFYFRTEKPDVFMASLSTAAGIVVNIVSGFFIHLHNKTQERSLHYHQQLAQIQKIATAIRLVEAHKDDIAQIEARNMVITYLLNGTSAPSLGEHKSEVARS